MRYLVFVGLFLLLVSVAPNASSQEALTGVLYSQESNVYLTVDFQHQGEELWCTDSASFNHNMKGPMFRIERDDGHWLKYQGILGAPPPYEPWKIIVFPPNSRSSEVFNVSENYKLEKGYKYTLNFSLPVTKCVPLIEGSVSGVPHASLLFWMKPSDDFSNWAEREASFLSNHTAWARHGKFVHMKEVVIDLRGE